MARRFDRVGTIRKVRAGDPYVVGEVPGKIPLVIADEEVGDWILGYFPRERRPQVGARIGARGQYVVMDVPLERIPPEEREWIGNGNPVQFQLDVEEWAKVSEDYDPFDEWFG